MSLCLVGGTSTDGAAGLSIDLATARALGVEARLLVTAVTAQDEQGVEAIHEIDLAAQAVVLRRGPKPVAIKSGMLTPVAVEVVQRLVNETGAKYVCDPVLAAGSGSTLGQKRAFESLLSRADLLTPNLPEAEALLGRPIEDLAEAAQALRARGARAVLLKGGHRHDDFCDDYFTDGTKRFYLRSPRQSLGTAARTHGTGCALASAIAAGLAQGLPLAEAVVQAKALINRGLRLANDRHHRPFPLALPDWPAHATPADMPWIPATEKVPGTFCSSPPAEKVRGTFCSSTPAQKVPGTFLPSPWGERYAVPFGGFYPIVERAEWIERLAPAGVTTVQLRIKDLRGEALRAEVARGVEMARRYGIRLFVNDYWELAIELEAYGVHLGQEDLATADLSTIARAGLRLGISTHSYEEVARAVGVRPSYIAIGPIFPTTLKKMPYAPQGFGNLRRWRALLATPLVAIGGLNLTHAAEAFAAGADGVAVVSDITQNPDPVARARAWVDQWSRLVGCNPAARR